MGSAANRDPAYSALAQRAWTMTERPTTERGRDTSLQRMYGTCKKQ
jgi:hypothetical protein